MKNLTLYLSAVFMFLAYQVNAQCTAPSITPTSTSSCYSSSFYTNYSTSSPCTGSGFGGSGTAKIIPICTNGSADCIVMDYTGLPGSGGVSIELYSGCSGTTLSGYVSGSVNCYPNATDFVFSTADLGLNPNTCYYALVWSKNGFPAGSQFCTYTQTPPNDECTGAIGIDATPQTTDNYCMTAGASDPAPADLCAASLENTAWYTFTVSADGDVVITIDNITCYGGGSGFQIGFFSGSCGSLTNDGCSSGSGGSVTATYTGLTAGDQLYIAIDGNAGAACSYDISATNTVPLPIELLSFNAQFDPNKKVVDLSWTTLTEINNDYFTIERTLDGENYEVIAIVDGSGTINYVKDYGTVDKEPYLNTVSYYRLKQTDYDGKTTESALVAVSTKIIDEVVVLPNPVSNNATLNVTSHISQNITVKMYDMTGKLVFNHSVGLQEGQNQIPLSLQNLSKGIYMLMIKDENSQILKQIKVFKD
tara:strand:+ start:20999 stop:22429 length:1431 start_codon:yes stop_codon:yes gene_type:complete